MEKKKIGAVIPVRNDNYGENLNERATYSLNSAIDTYDYICLIDWNSDINKGPLLWDIKKDLQLKGNLFHFIIEPEIASILTNHDPNAQKCCEVLCRNIGIRRLLNKCDWIMSTNIDIIHPRREDLDDLIKELSPETFYTISRRHTDWKTINEYFEQNEYYHTEWKSNWKHLRNYLIDISEERYFPEKTIEGDDYSLINCSGDAQLASSYIWNEVRGFEEELIYSLFADTNVQKKAVMHGFGLKALYNPALFHIEHGKGGGGFLDGINKNTNSHYRAITAQNKTENSESWGFGNTEIEFEIF